MPDGWNAWQDTRKLAVLRHERVHMRQARQHGMLKFALLYLLVPLPIGLAWYRAQFEWEAYEESMRAVAELHGLAMLEDEKYKLSILSHFTTGAYGWMWPFPKQVGEWYEASRVKIEAEKRGYGG